MSSTHNGRTVDTCDYCNAVVLKEEEIYDVDGNYLRTWYYVNTVETQFLPWLIHAWVCPYCAARNEDCERPYDENGEV